ncbi:hypothetical protein [uncultured Mediterranean phage]|nr:hypothetical protein [uncultured Mediterranean phage]
MTQQTKTVALGTDFNAPVLDMNDAEIQSEGEDGAVETLRLGDVCVNALMATLQDDNSADGTVKLKRFSLAKKIKGRIDEDYQSVQINSKNKTMILDMAQKVYSTMIYGRLHEALEGTTETDED